MAAELAMLREFTYPAYELAMVSAADVSAATATIQPWYTHRVDSTAAREDRSHSHNLDNSGLSPLNSGIIVRRA